MRLRKPSRLGKAVQVPLDTSKLALKKPSITETQPDVTVYLDGSERCVTVAAWQRRRKEAWERDNHTCQGIDCGKYVKLSDAHVHHKRHRSLGRDDRLKNLLTLCPDCHRKEHNQ